MTQWNIRKLSLGVWHPVLYAIYTVLALFTHNLGEIVFPVIIRPLSLVVLFALIVLGIYQLIFKNWDKAGLIASWSLLLFSTYGHNYELLRGFGLGESIGRHRFLLAFWAVLFFLGLIYFSWKVKDAKPLTNILNVISVTLVMFSLLSMGQYYFVRSRSEATYEINLDELDLSLDVPQNPPDIYYIILDGYTRSDVLMERFGYDNSNFLMGLENLGFYIADCSRSNYILTQLTLPTMLNMAYADELFGEIETDATFERVPLEKFTKDNNVMKILQSIGYQTVAFETSYYWSHFNDADFYLEPTNQSLVTTNLTRFEEMYLGTTLLSVLLDWQQFTAIANIKPPIMPREMHFIRINFVLDKLKSLPELDGPQFIFAHMIIPHKPYIFNEEGLIPDLNLYNADREIGDSGHEGYINNIRFINKEILVVIEEIMRQSPNEPIIIIQSDHGSDFFDRSINFSAFYFPNNKSNALYPSITPVNTFRLVFNQFFGAELQLLPDISYRGENGIFDFIPIDESYPQCLNDG